MAMCICFVLMRCWINKVKYKPLSHRTKMYGEYHTVSIDSKGDDDTSTTESNDD